MHTQPNSGVSAHDAPATAPTHEPKWWRDAQHGPYIAESLSNGMTARVVHYATPHSQLGEILQTFTGTTAWSDAARAAQDLHQSERANLAADAVAAQNRPNQ